MPRPKSWFGFPDVSGFRFRAFQGAGFGCSFQAKITSASGQLQTRTPDPKPRTLLLLSFTFVRGPRRSLKNEKRTTKHQTLNTPYSTLKRYGAGGRVQGAGCRVQGAGFGFQEMRRATTRWSLTLSAKVNLQHVSNFRDTCGANLVT